MTTPPTLVLDLDGTLVDTAPDLAAAMNVLLDRRGRRRLDLAEVRRSVGRGAIELMRAAMAKTGTPASDTDLARMLEEFIDHYGANIAVASRPFPGAVAALDRFAAAGWALAVCTNKPEGLTLMLLDALGLTPRFAAILGADTLEVRKPDPRHLTETVARAGGRVDAAIMVGDSVTDVDTARAAGIAVVGVSFGYTPTPMVDLGPDRLINHFDELFAAATELLEPAPAIARD